MFTSRSFETGIWWLATATDILLAEESLLKYKVEVDFMTAALIYQHTTQPMVHFQQPYSIFSAKELIMPIQRRKQI
jgi:hypothetical protein